MAGICSGGYVQISVTEPVMQAFVRDGRITHMPVSASERLVLLRWLADDFETGRRYSEKMVNLIIGQRHADTATLRRYMVDEGIFAREAGEYWRTTSDPPSVA